MNKRRIINCVALILSFVFLMGDLAFSKEKLPSNITKIALVIGSEKEAVESSFGHAFLRFTSKSDFDISDVTVEFTADASSSPSTLRGIGFFPYKMQVTLGKYGETSLQHTQVMDRDLKQYELNFTPQEVQAFVDLVNERIEQGHTDSYNFFFNNCTSVISSMIETSTDKKIQGFSENVPVWLPKKLKELKLIRREFETLSNTSIRNKIIDKNFSGIMNQGSGLLFLNLKAQLKSERIQDRVIAYAKLIHLAKNGILGQEALNFGKRLVNNEQPEFRLNFLNLLNLKLEDSYEFSFVDENSLIEVSEQEARYLRNEKSTGFFRNQKGLVELVIKTRQLVDDSRGERSIVEKNYQFPMPQIRIDEKKKNLTVNNKLVDLLDENLKVTNVNSKNHQIYPEIITIGKKKYLMPIFIVDNLASWYWLQETSEWKQNGIHLLNKRTTESPVGNCYGLVILQKKLMENVYFRPHEEKRVNSYYEKQISMALGGDKIIVPGLSSIQELTKVVTDEKMQSVVTELNQNLVTFANLASQWFAREEINSTSLKKMKSYVDNGIYPILTFVPYKKIKAEHALVLYDVEETNDSYLLHVYDPNFGFIPKVSKMQFKVSKKDFSFSSSVYKEAASESLRVNFK